MTAGGGSTNLWSSAKSSLGAWLTRERHTICALNLVLLTMFREHLDGMKLPVLRKAVSLAVPPAKHAQVKQDLHIVLFKP